MILVLTMAGTYSRFRKFSYEIPKYLLPLSNRTILHYIIKNLSDSQTITKLVLVANHRDKRFHFQIKDTAEELFDSTNIEIQYINDTDGQAISCLLGIQNSKILDDETPVMIHNVDTILLRRNLHLYSKKIKSCDCLIDIFESSNKEYSYIIHENSLVREIKEKMVISNTASSGCYLFRNKNKILQYFDYETCYISECILAMINNGERVVASPCWKESETLVLGTPEEYINSMNSLCLGSG